MGRVREFLFAAPPRDHAETLAEKRQRWFENGMAIMMAVAAISATWASFESSRWGGKAGGLVSESSIARADSNRYAARGAEQTSVDGSLWIEWEKAVIKDQDEVAAFLRDRFSPALDAAQDAWLKKTALDQNEIPIGNQLPKGTPMGLDEYVPPGQAESERLAELSESKLAGAEKFGAVSGKYTLLTILFALTLFFGSVATKFTGPKIQLALGSLALLLLLSSLARMALLPVT